MNVLIVDDNKIVRNGLEKMFPWEEIGAKVVGTAADGEEALELMKNRKVDIIISDIKMPNIDGLELCKKVKEEYENVHIILISAYEDFHYAHSAMKLGVKHYILKPLDDEKSEMLKEIVKDIINESVYKKKLYEDLFNGTVERRIIDALKTKDQDFFTNFFEEELDAYERLGFDMVGVCLKLLDTLFLYFNEMGIKAENLINSKEKTISKLFSIEEKCGMLYYISNLYNEIILFSKSTNKEENHKELINKAVMYINNNFSDPFLSLTDMAGYVGISSSYLSVIFREQVGINVTNYLTELRISKSKQMLEGQNIKIQDIVKEVGFQNQKYFASVFKKNTGITPTEYRQILSIAKQ